MKTPCDLQLADLCGCADADFVACEEHCLEADATAQAKAADLLEARLACQRAQTRLSIIEDELARAHREQKRRNERKREDQLPTRELAFSLPC